jgi:hypothetical protein
VRPTAPGSRAMHRRHVGRTSPEGTTKFAHLRASTNSTAEIDDTKGKPMFGSSFHGQCLHLFVSNKIAARRKGICKELHGIRENSTCFPKAHLDKGVSGPRPRRRLFVKNVPLLGERSMSTHRKSYSLPTIDRIHLQTRDPRGGAGRARDTSTQVAPARLTALARLVCLSLGESLVC